MKDKNIEEMTALVKVLKPRETLSVLALYSGVEHRNRRKLSEAGLELIQYLFLTSPLEAPLLVPSADDIIRLIELANEAYEDFLQSRIAPLEELGTTERHVGAEKARRGAQDFRNWGYSSDTIEIISEMVNPISNHVKKHSGFDLSVFSRLVEYFLVAIVGEPFSIFYQGDEPTAEWSESFFIDVLLSTQNLERCISRYCVSIETFADELNVDEDDLRNILSALSISPGECELIYVHEILTLNPICIRPFIKLAEDHFMIASVTILNSFFMEMITYLLHDHGHHEAYNSFNRRRGKYIEQKTFELFKKSFPVSEVYNNIYIDDFKSSEKDIVLKYGDVLLIIEVKSHGIRKGVKKAGLRSLEKLLEDTIKTANKQTLDLKESLMSGTLARVAKTKKLSFIIDPNKTTKVYRLIVLFRELGGLHTNYRNLERITGSLGDDVFVMTLTDLIVVFDILSSPSERMDYLLQRIKLERAVYYHGDEMDLLGYYLLNRFDINFDKYKNKVMLFDGQAAIIDAYKTKVFMTGTAEKPKFEIMPFWENLIQTLERRLGDQSRMISGRLFRFNFNTQKKVIEDLEEAFLKIKYARDKDSYQTFTSYDDNSKILVRFVVMKYYNLEDFDADRKELDRLADSDCSLIHSIYFNATTNGEYAGYMALKPKKKKQIINLRKAILQSLA